MKATVSVFCAVAWRWPKGKTINEAYIEEVVGPFATRAIATRWKRIREKKPNRAVMVTVLKACCEDCIE